MTNPRTRLIWFLADPATTDSQFDALARWLTEGGLPECLDAAWNLRQASKQVDKANGRRYSPILNRREPVNSAEDAFVAEVGRLLRDEAHLTARAAIEALLHDLDVDRHMPERISFKEAVLRLSGDVGEPAVLSAAHRIRNDQVHARPQTDWPLANDR